MTTALAIAGAVLAYLLVIGLFIRRTAARAETTLEQALAGRRPARAETVRGLGVESRGRAQVRGTGRLALVEDELVFVQWVPRRETRIPLGSIEAIETPRVFLGKTVGRRLLAVSWRTADGAPERAAWEVRDLDAWRAALSAAGAPA